MCAKIAPPAGERNPSVAMRGESEKTKGYAWVILFIVFLASVIAPLNQFKVPPVIPQLMDQFHLDMTSVGLLMSVFSIAGFVLSLPTGFFFGKLGAKVSGLLSISLIIARSLWGMYSTTSTMLLLSRTLEGAGMAIIGVIAPVILSAWFPARMRGLALGIWSTWFSVGVILMMNLAPLLLRGGTWRTVWLFATAACVVALVLFAVFYRDPEGGLAGVSEPHGGASHPKENLLLAVLSIRDIWLLSLALVVFNILVMAMNTFLPAFLSKVHHMSPESAGFYSSLSNMVMVVSCPLGGWISDRLNSRKWIISIGLGMLSVWWALMFGVSPRMIPILAVYFGLIAGPIITIILAALPEVVKRPELMGFGMAMQMFNMKLGAFIGPLLFGRLLDLSSWTTAAHAMIPICLFGAVCASAMRTR